MLNTVLIGLGMVADTHLRALADLKDRIHLQGVFARQAAAREAFGRTVQEHCGHAPMLHETIDSVVQAAPDFVCSLLRKSCKE